MEQKYNLLVLERDKNSRENWYNTELETEQWWLFIVIIVCFSCLFSKNKKIWKMDGGYIIEQWRQKSLNSEGYVKVAKESEELIREKWTQLS